MFSSCLFAVLMALTIAGVMSQTSIAKVQCGGGPLGIGSLCAVPNASVVDLGLMDVHLVDDGKGGKCGSSSFFLTIVLDQVYLQVLQQCHGTFNIVKIDPPTYSGGCGNNVVLDGSRIVGGQRSPPCTYPWMAHIMKPYSTCAGSIIDKQHILTSAGCASFGGYTYFGAAWILDLASCCKYIHRTPDELSVRTGSIHEKTGKANSVKAIFLHPDYNTTQNHNDIAILRLTEAIKFDGCQSPVCLGDDASFVGDGTKCRIMGFGLTWKSGSADDFLEWGQETLISNDQCKKIFPWGHADGSVFCSKADEVSPCTNDDGSPIVCLDGNKWFAYGLYVRTDSPNCIDSTGLFINVPHYQNWIQQTIDSA